MEGKGLEVSICENCGSPKLRIEHIGGSEDGESVSICLTIDAYVQLTARLIYIGKQCEDGKALRVAVAEEVAKLMKGDTT